MIININKAQFINKIDQDKITCSPSEGKMNYVISFLTTTLERCSSKQVDCDTFMQQME